MGDFVGKILKKINPDIFELNVAPDHECLQYMGRIDFSKAGGPEFVFPCTFVKIKFSKVESYELAVDTRKDLERVKLFMEENNLV